MSELADILGYIDSFSLYRPKLHCNIEKSKLLIERCEDIKAVIELLRNHEDFHKLKHSTIKQLSQIIKRVNEILYKYSDIGCWKHLFRISNINKSLQDYRQLFIDLSDCSDEIQSSIGFHRDQESNDRYSIVKLEREAKAILDDDNAILVKLNELLELYGITVPSSYLTLQPEQSLVQLLSRFDDKFRKFSGILHDTEELLNILYPDSGSNDDNASLTVLPGATMVLGDSDPVQSSPLKSDKSKRMSKRFSIRRRSSLFRMIDESQIVLSELKPKQKSFFTLFNGWLPKDCDVVGGSLTSKVYEGIYMKNPVSIKFIPELKNQRISKTIIKQYEREITILNKCQNQNLIKITSYDLKEGLAVMEYVATNLHDMIYGVYDKSIRHTNIPEETKISWIRDIALGLQYIHYFDVVHGNLRPINVLLIQQTCGMIAKLSDFGLCVVKGQPLIESSTAIFGPDVRYQAPEVLTGKSPSYSKASDVYSFGVVVNEVFSGEKPFLNQPDADIAKSIAKDNRPALFVPLTRKQRKIIEIIGSHEKGCLHTYPNLRFGMKIINIMLPKSNSRVPQLPERNPGTATSSLSDKEEFLRATINGKIAVVKRLLDRTNIDINNASDFDGWNGLNNAAFNGHTDIVVLLLNRGADIEYSLADGWTPLWIASQKGHIDVVRVLLDYGANLEAYDKEHNRTSLYIACRFNKIELVQLLIERKANIEAADKEGSTPFLIACREGHIEILKLLSESFVNVNASDKNGWTALMIASQTGHTEVVTFLLQEGVDLEARQKNDATALIIACHNGHVDIASLLLDHGANIEAADKFGNTPLLIAAQRGNVDVVRLLLDRGANIEATDKDFNRTALIIASSLSEPDVMLLLLERRANINATDKSNTSLLYKSCEKGHTEVVEILLLRGVNIEAVNKDNNGTPLYIACERGYEDIVKILLQHNADIRAMNKDGWKPLEIACRNGHDDIVKILLDAGADIEGRTKGGHTPLIISCWHGHEAIVKLLCERGANIHAKNNDGDSPLLYATKQNHTRIVTYLKKRGAT